MKLSAIQLPGLEFVRDGSFAALGLISDHREQLLTFAESEEYAVRAAAMPQITAVITTSELLSFVSPHQAVAVHKSPKKAFFEVHSLLATKTDFYMPARAGVIAESARVHATAVIDATASIGAESDIGPGAVIGSGVQIGSRCLVRAGAVVGGEGFEFKRWGGEVQRIPHTGTVILGDEVEILQNAVVNRSVFGGATVIGPQTKVDSLVYVSHNCRVGARCLIAASAVLSGSVTLEDDVWVGPGAVISSGVTVGARARVAIGSVIMQDVAAGTTAVGRALGHIVSAGGV